MEHGSRWHRHLVVQNEWQREPVRQYTCFGYDPVFIPDELPSNDGGLVPNTDNLTLADIPEEDKNAISHRGKALRMMAAFLKEREK